MVFIAELVFLIGIDKVLSENFATSFTSTLPSSSTSMGIVECAAPAVFLVVERKVDLLIKKLERYSIPVAGVQGT